MKSLQSLRKAAQEGLAWICGQKGVTQAEVFVASNEQLIARINYTSDIPCNGVEETKSNSSFGVGVRVAFQHDEEVRTGFGSQPGDISLRGVEMAFERTRSGAALDPEFVSLPRPSNERPIRQRFHDPEAVSLSDERLVTAAWRTLDGALDAFSVAGRLQARSGLIVGGDVTLRRERITVAGTNLPQVETDESTAVLASLTAMVERGDAKGSGWSASAFWQDFDARAGAEAARNAVAAMGGQRVPDGEYRVVFGPQAVADLFHNLILPSLQADAFYSAASPFLGKMQQRVAWERLSVYDHGAVPRLAGSKRITCEGLTTGRTDLIRRGRLVGLLSNYYESQRLLKDPRAREKLGVDPGECAEAMTPRNGFRLTDGRGRHFAMPPYIAATNVFVESDERQVSHEDLLRRVGNGLYVGRIWYTYPVNGLAAGDFTCTVVADSYLIKDGAISGPLKANAVRIDDNISRVLNNVLGIGGQVRATNVWAAPEIIHAPEMATAGVPVRGIGYSTDNLS